jgi:hypothetical protein
MPISNKKEKKKKSYKGDKIKASARRVKPSISDKIEISKKSRKVIYNTPYRHFRIAILDNKQIYKSKKSISTAQAVINPFRGTPIDAAKKLMSSICKYQGFKKMKKLKCRPIFWMIETTRGHSKIYGPYKGKYVNLMKNGKEKIVKLRNGTIIKYSVKPVVKKYKQKIDKSLQKKVNKIMKI